MINRVVLVGRLVRDPNMRYTQNGVAVTTFTLAVDRPFVGADGDRKADFISIVAWRKLAEIVGENLKKGRQVAVEGRLQSRSYENRDGQRVYVTEVVAENILFLDAPRGRREEGEAEAAPAVGGPVDPFFDAEEVDLSEDDLPF
ncbi:MAG: Single-stranded DNA-binding protein [Brockia lithotrophica]|uniref:Single-stranded DNA-binding protein n=1 Tax=Brockia lithotrophica TaxID=933949 RepID=A0A2T5GB41_9BACL|nr:single-stranded DNA-binding protein [Brockia lithotrophica]PTQ53382.1 MAG: Single-stranded DNA-binding protein [Brockia lithotrophica]